MSLATAADRGTEIGQLHKQSEMELNLRNNPVATASKGDALVHLVANWILAGMVTELSQLA